MGPAVAHYRITGKLGEGGMGAVFRAHDTKLGRDVAIKVLPPSLANDADYVARFQREAQVLASLNHPNIAAIYGLEDNAIVMELIEGAELKGPLPPDEVVRIAKRIADALEAAHERGIVHRDLKPANIRVTPDGTVKVLDFGLAKATEPAQAASASAANSPTLTIHATTAGVILGTAAYMSPEQAAGKPVDRRADIWAFGVVLWEMIAGRQLFQGETVSHTLAAVLKDEIDLKAIPAGPVRNLIGRCVERDVRKRLGWIGEARAILDAPASVGTKRERAWLPWVAAACVTAAISSAVYLLRQPEAPPAELTTFTIAAPEKEHFHGGAISPDGRRIAAEIDSGGGQETTYLAIRSLDSLEMVRLAGTDAVYNAFWSPDGKSVAYFSKGKLKKVDLNGTAPVSLCDLPNPAARHRGFWHANGTILVSLLRTRNRDGALGPWIVPGSGGSPQPLPVKEGDVLRLGADLLPDGRRYLYNTQGAAEIRLGYIDKPDSQAVLQGFRLTAFVPSRPGSSAGHLVYSRGNKGFAQGFDASDLRLSGERAAISEDMDAADRFGVTANAIVYQASLSEAARLQWMPLEGAAVPIEQPANYSSIALAPDGKRIAVTIISGEASEVWVIDTERQIRWKLSTIPGSKRSALWSPDGSRIVYVISNGNKHVLYSQAVNGGATPTVLLESEQPMTPHSFTPDGRTLVYSISGPKTGRDLWLLGPDRKPRPYLQTEALARQGQVSPDGKWMAYTSGESGVSEIYVRPFPDAAGGKWQVSNSEGAQPRWSPDGTKLYYLDGGRRLTVCPVKTGSSFQSGSPTTLFPVMVPSAYTGGQQYDSYYAIDPSGNRILVMSEPETGAPLVVMQNWRARLR